MDENRKRGRPSTGGRMPRVKLCLPLESLEQLDAAAERQNVNRSEAVRRLIASIDDDPFVLPLDDPFTDAQLARIATLTPAELRLLRPRQRGPDPLPQLRLAVLRKLRGLKPLPVNGPDPFALSPPEGSLAWKLPWANGRKGARTRRRRTS